MVSDRGYEVRTNAGAVRTRAGLAPCGWSQPEHEWWGGPKESAGKDGIVGG